MELHSTQIIQVIQQYLNGLGYEKSVEALQQESKVQLVGAIQDNRLFEAIRKGDWIVVLSELQKVSIPPKHLIDLYEQMVLEWIEVDQIDAARSLLRQTDPMEILRNTDVDRYVMLEGLAGRSQFDSKLTEQKLERRQRIAKGLEEHVKLVAPDRLVTLLGQALKWQISQKLIDPEAPYDLFFNQVPFTVPQEDEPIHSLFKTIKFPKKSHAEAAAFSPDGKFLAIGTIDGFIEIYNYITGKLRKDLKYQAEDNIMLLESACLCLSFSNDSHSLVSGAQDGSIDVWDVVKGTCIRHFASAHPEGVTSVLFSKDNTQVLSSSFDQTVRIHGLKSGKMLKAFRGHSSFVNSARYSSDEACIISGSSDGTVKIWNAQTTDCLATSMLTEGRVSTKSVNISSVHTIIPLKTHKDLFLVSNQSNYVYLINIAGKLAKNYEIENFTHAVAATLSSNGELFYVCNEKEIRCIALATGKVMSKLTAIEVSDNNAYQISPVEPSSDTFSISTTATTQRELHSTKQQEKLTHLLGQTIQVDIHNNDILKEGMPKLILSIKPLSFFLEYLFAKVCSEMLFFYLAVEEYENNIRNVHYFDAEQQRAGSKLIMDLYIGDQSPLEVNIPATARKEILVKVSQGKFLEAFTAAKDHCGNLMMQRYREARNANVVGLSEKDSNAITFQDVIILLELLAPRMSNTFTIPRDIILAELTKKFCAARLEPLKDNLEKELMEGTDDHQAKHTSLDIAPRFPSS